MQPPNVRGPRQDRYGGNDLMSAHAPDSAVQIGTSIASRRSAEWLATGTIDDVRDELVDIVCERGGRISELEPDAFEAAFGSRLAYRLGGALLKASRERLPLKARVTLAPAHDSLVQVVVTVHDDGGWYAFSVDWRDRLDAADRLLADLHNPRNRRATANA